MCKLHSPRRSSLAHRPLEGADSPSAPSAGAGVRGGAARPPRQGGRAAEAGLRDRLHFPARRCGNCLSSSPLVTTRAASPARGVAWEVPGLRPPRSLRADAPHRPSEAQPACHPAAAVLRLQEDGPWTSTNNLTSQAVAFALLSLRGPCPSPPPNTQLPTPSVWGRRQSTGSVAWQRHLTPVRPEFPAERAAVGY